MARPYDLDPLFFGSKDHMKSMKSCVPRIMDWLREFDSGLTADARMTENADPDIIRTSPISLSP